MSISLYAGKSDGVRTEWFALDGSRMLEILAQMEGMVYAQSSLREKLYPVRKKIEKSDYMSAMDMISQIRDSLKSEEQSISDVAQQLKIREGASEE